MSNHNSERPASRKLKLAKRALLLVIILSFAGGCYLMLLVLWPKITTRFGSDPSWNIQPSQSAIGQNYLHIPKLKLSLAYNSGGADVLDIGAWHRFPERGDPEKGGNFILSGHRFRIGLTPTATINNSPFYNINILQPGDKIYVDFNGGRYQYEITRKYQVAPTQTDIESPSQDHKMTLYTCTLKGASDGREVIEATLITKNIDVRQELK